MIAILPCLAALLLAIFGVNATGNSGSLVSCAACKLVQMQWQCKHNCQIKKQGDRTVYCSDFFLCFVAAASLHSGTGVNCVACRSGEMEFDSVHRQICVIYGSVVATFCVLSLLIVYHLTVHISKQEYLSVEGPLPLANKTSSTYNLTWNYFDLGMTLTLFMTLTSEKWSQVILMSSSKNFLHEMTLTLTIVKMLT